jgi:hypothetical protein
MHGNKYRKIHGKKKVMMENNDLEKKHKKIKRSWHVPRCSDEPCQASWRIQ